MEKNMSCCGVICSNANTIPASAPAARRSRERFSGRSNAGLTVCEKYECCVIQKKLAHCKCGELPCRRYDLDDPNLSPEEKQTDP